MSDPVHHPPRGVSEVVPARTRGSRPLEIGFVVAGFVLLGVVCGVLWWWAWDPAEFTKVDGGEAMGEIQLGKRFGADGWYITIAAVAGLVAGLLLALLRVRDPMVRFLSTLAGSAAAAAVMTWTGSLLGPGDADARLATAQAGDRVPVGLTLSIDAAYLVWPIAALVGLLLVFWSWTGPRWPDRQPSAEGEVSDRAGDAPARPSPADPDSPVRQTRNRRTA